MNNRILVRWIKYIFLAVFIMGGANDAVAQTPLKGKELRAAITDITAGYTPWRAAGWQAKVKSDMLPVSITMKVYMVKDSITLISLRAPLMGEVARVEIDNSSIVAVNKMKKKYAKINLSDYGKYPRLIHSDIQNILIGRVAIIGSGALSDKNASKADIFSVNGEGYVISSQLPAEFGGVGYGYAVDTAARIVSFMATKGKTTDAASPSGMDSTIENISFEAAAEMSYRGDTADAVLNAIFKGHNVNLSLEGIRLEKGAAGFERLNLAKGYSPGTIKELLSF